MSTAPGVCVSVSTAPGVCVCVCVLGWVKCREHISLLVILFIIVYVTKKIYNYRLSFFFQNRYPIMVKCLNIGKNFGKPIYRSISKINTDQFKSNKTNKNVKYILAHQVQLNENEKCCRGNYI